jgi:ATP-dependent helicase HepA
VLGNEKKFLAMLHLLDPVVYSFDDESSFSKKIQNRQALAELVAGFVPENVLQLDAFIDKLRELFPEDKILKDCTERLRLVLSRLPSEDDEELRQTIFMVRAHITETYRLHRRILRNRRRTVGGLTPRRAGAEKVFFTSATLGKVAEVLEEWRSRAASSIYGQSDPEYEKKLQRLFVRFVEAVITDPNLFHTLVQERLSRPKDCDLTPASGDELSQLCSGARLFEGEKECLAQTMELLQEHNDLERFDCTSNAIKEILLETKKVVVFCTYAHIADRLYEHLHRQFGDMVTRHALVGDSDTEGDKVDSSWQRFMADPECRVLVCDRRAEEGLNLQGGSKAVIHFDLPLSRVIPSSQS